MLKKNAKNPKKSVKNSRPEATQSRSEADRQTDRRTPVKQNTPDLSMRGHEKSYGSCAMHFSIT